MQMLAYLSHRIRTISIFIDDGKRLEEKFEEKSLKVVDENIRQNMGENEESGCDIDMDYYPSESEESDNELTDLELFDENDSLVKETIAVVDDDISKLLDDYVSNDENKNDSDYASSDSDVHSFESDDNDDDISRFKYRRKKIVYNPKCDNKILNIVIWMQFQDGFECKEALTTWAIETGRFIHFKRVEKDSLEAKCNLPCPWRVYASVVKAKKIFKIKTYDELQMEWDGHSSVINRMGLQMQSIR
ncbi:hypothetical protein AAHA92_16646 [Salvia divinorum]|uniref:Transposase MuDR plant domain-containing protein n=1 Tax=Salvia divinorum TaxID=28513 RepID=A0ABD1GW68_SALDI